MFIHDRRNDLGYQITKLESGLSGDYTGMGPDIGALGADINSDGELVGKRNWRIKQRAGAGIRNFGVTVRDSWLPFMGGTGGATLAVTGLNEGFSYIPDVPWVIPALVGGLVGWKTGEWGNKATVKAISLIGRPFRAFNERYYFKL